MLCYMIVHYIYHDLCIWLIVIISYHYRQPQDQLRQEERGEHELEGRECLHVCVIYYTIVCVCVYIYIYIYIRLCYAMLVLCVCYVQVTCVMLLLVRLRASNAGILRYVCLACRIVVDHLCHVMLSTFIIYVCCVILWYDYVWVCLAAII